VTILVVYAHPYPHRSRACATLLAQLEGMAGLRVRSLYDLYPDFDVDPAAEQALLGEARLVVWMHPLQWYSVPSLMKHWFDKVLSTGFAFGGGGGKLAGRDCLWVTTTGGKQSDYTSAGLHQHAFEAFAAPIEQTARYCGLRWLAPFVLHDAEDLTEPELLAAGRRLRARLDAREKEAG
jgi:glutathione-regulated potassium-efflux system ancillary protein KefF